ncbi:hypothetical protein DF185_07905 [Marinifilum breve]|uniref:DUF3168 domain-containing protein n=1 Tax=Marinifilum breve TaxID=2184082 RepID=A0A2V3ZY61_9BACT|nr:DUF3168 domain-containing protein [Marinifilum breve]PXY01399.1 hypothetical protein DF185_07905 [Marinifilum breve]
MNITSFINQKLKANPELVELTKNQIYPICADEDTTGNYIVFQQDGQKPVYYQDYRKRNETLVTARIYVVSQSYDEAVSILSKVTETLETNGCEFTSLYGEDYDQVYEYFVIETQIEKRMN